MAERCAGLKTFFFHIPPLLRLSNCSNKRVREKNCVQSIVSHRRTKREGRERASVRPPETNGEVDDLCEVVKMQDCIEVQQKNAYDGVLLRETYELEQATASRN